MKSLLVAGLLIYVSGALCACGQKGPLVLPDAPKRKHTIPTMPGTASPKDHNGSTPPPAESNMTTVPAPPASPTAPQPDSTPPQR